MPSRSRSAERLLGGPSFVDRNAFRSGLRPPSLRWASIRQALRARDDATPIPTFRAGDAHDVGLAAGFAGVAPDDAGAARALAIVTAAQAALRAVAPIVVEPAARARLARHPARNAGGALGRGIAKELGLAGNVTDAGSADAGGGLAPVIGAAECAALTDAHVARAGLIQGGYELASGRRLLGKHLAAHARGALPKTFARCAQGQPELRGNLAAHARAFQVVFAGLGGLAVAGLTQARDAGTLPTVREIGVRIAGASSGCALRREHAGLSRLTGRSGQAAHGVVVGDDVVARRGGPGVTTSDDVGDGEGRAVGKQGIGAFVVEEGARLLHGGLTLALVQPSVALASVEVDAGLELAGRGGLGSPAARRRAAERHRASAAARFPTGIGGPTLAAGISGGVAASASSTSAGGGLRRLSVRCPASADQR